MNMKPDKKRNGDFEDMEALNIAIKFRHDLIKCQTQWKRQACLEEQKSKSDDKTSSSSRSVILESITSTSKFPMTQLTETIEQGEVINVYRFGGDPPEQMLLKYLYFIQEREVNYM